MTDQDQQNTHPLLNPLMGFSGLQGNDTILSALLQVIPFSPLIQSNNLNSLQKEHRDVFMDVLQKQGGGEFSTVLQQLMAQSEPAQEDVDHDDYPEFETPISNSVENLAKVIAKKETALQQTHDHIDTKIDTLRNSAIAQSEVMILCPMDGQSGARMYLHNPLPRQVSLTFEPQLGGGVPHSLQSAIELDIETTGQTMMPDSTASIRLQVSLMPHADWQAVNEVGFHINAIAEARTVSTIWVTVRVVR